MSHRISAPARARAATRTVLAPLAATAVTAALVAVPLVGSPAAANPAGTGLVISEAYGGGGNSGAALTTDFVELHNPTGAPISLAGTSLQYRSSSGTGASRNVFALPDVTIAPDGYYVVAGASGSNGDPLPTEPDATSSLNLSGSRGQIYLADAATGIDPGTGAIDHPAVIDFVGWGSGTTSFETAAAPGTGNATAVNRTAGDTDDNAADFVVSAPTPGVEWSEPAPPEELDATIAEVQGTGDTSPLEGDVVTTRGVVTAAYPDGGLNGFYIQTPGTGGGADATPGASDGLFVYGPSFDEATLSLGDLVEVTGPVSEYSGTTEITVEDPADVVAVDEAHEPVTALVGAYPTTEAEREAHEGELLAPTDQFTVSDTYSTNRFGEIGLATGDKPLITPTEVADAQDTAAVDAVEADNFARGVVLDDGAGIDFLDSDHPENADIPLPWISPENPVRVGAPATLTGHVVLEFRHGGWRFQPTTQVTDEGADVATFENTRTPAPEAVPGDLHIATFNVLNYFNTTGKDYVEAGGSCTYYIDRDGDPVGNRDCGPTGPRGAAEDEDLARQQTKIVAAINALGADVVSLEEIENSVVLGEADRDDALAELVDALNAEAGADTWAFAPSPDAADLPPLAEQDVIRTAFIYKPDAVELVGESQVLVGSEAFSNAREPLAQAFKPVGAADDEAFTMIVNHFKSKGSGEDDGTGQGNANPDRIAQAEALAVFADSFAAERGTEKVFLVGDFNSYTMEDPMQVLYGAGYTKVDSDTPGEMTYSYDGMSGSLDHVLANDAALADVAGADIWNINSGESVAFEYSRHNYNATDFYAPDVYRSSDHDPEVVGLSVAPTVEVDLDVRVTPRRIWEDRTRAKAHVRVEVDGTRARHGEVTILLGDEELADGRVRHGKAHVRLPVFDDAGRHTLTVVYTGRDGVQQETTVDVRVHERRGRNRH